MSTTLLNRRVLKDFGKEKKAPPCTNEILISDVNSAKNSLAIIYVFKNALPKICY